jgi:hypothetical protein
LDWVTAAGRWLWRHRLTVYTVVLGLALVWALTALRLGQLATDRTARIAAIATADNAAQNDRIEGLVHQLEDETRERTTQSCLNSQASRNGTIALWLGVLDFLAPKDANGNPVPNERISQLKAIVEASYPPVTCPQDQGPIVIPTPSTTLPP